MGVPCLDEGSTPSVSTLKIAQKNTNIFDYVSVFFCFLF